MTWKMSQRGIWWREMEAEIAALQSERRRYKQELRNCRERLKWITAEPNTQRLAGPIAAQIARIDKCLKPKRRKAR